MLDFGLSITPPQFLDKQLPKKSEEQENAADCKA